MTSVIMGYIGPTEYFMSMELTEFSRGQQRVKICRCGKNPPRTFKKGRVVPSLYFHICFIGLYRNRFYTGEGEGCTYQVLWPLFKWENKSGKCNEEPNETAAECGTIGLVSAIGAERLPGKCPCRINPRCSLHAKQPHSMAPRLLHKPLH